MTDQLALINEHARCPKCDGTGGFFLRDGTALECSHCLTTFDFEAEILDFVAGRQRTTLDDLDYDEMYDVDARLLDQFRSLEARAAPLFERRFESVLEIGAGTGGLTVGMLEGANIGTAIVTDISPKMLERCRDKVRAFEIETPVLYATNNGEDLNVKDESFDLVVAYFCVHHILDYQNFLASCYRALRPGGQAVFVEPGLRFLYALFTCMTPAIGRLARNAQNWHDPNFVALLGVHRNMYYTTKYVGDIAVVGELEDKHAFGGYEFEASARRAGFSSVETLPYGIADDPLTALRIYAMQLGASYEYLASFTQEVEIELPGPLQLLDPREAAPSLAFVLRKPDKPQAPIDGLDHAAEAAAYRKPLIPADMLELRYHFKISLPHKASGSVLRIEGWAVSRRNLRMIRFESSSGLLAVPVGSVSHPDVFASYVDRSNYAHGALLHCGFKVERVPQNAPFKRGDTVTVSIELDNGQVEEICPDITIRDDVSEFHFA